MSKQHGSPGQATSTSRPRPKSEAPFPGISHPKKRAFLRRFAEIGTISHTARAVGIDRRTHQNWMHDDPLYADAFLYTAVPERNDALEAEARRRAVEGVPKPVYQGGRLVGHVPDYSDTLLIFLMKGAMPERYRDRVETTSSVRVGPAAPDLSKLTDDELDQVMRLARRWRRRRRLRRRMASEPRRVRWR